jgi:hypothetical protein
MENHKENNLAHKFPQLKLNEESKDRIHTALLHHQPSSSTKNEKVGRIRNIATGLIGLLLFSVLTAYILSEAEKDKADQLFAAAKEQITSVYETMQTNMKSVKTSDLLPSIKKSAIATAQATLHDAEKKLSDMSKENKEALKQQLIPKMKEIEEYNQIVPSANRLQKQINDVSEMISDDPFNRDISMQLSKVKGELSDFTVMTNKLENPSLKSFFQGRYTPQISLLEKNITAYKGVSNGISELRTIAEKLSLPPGEFDQEVSRLSEKVEKLPNNAAKADMKEELANISQDYERNQVAATEEKKRLEEKRKAEEEKRLAEEKRKAEEEKRLAEEKKKAEGEESQLESEEIFPMEFIEISQDGHKIINSRRPNNDDRFYKYDEIAKKYGGRYYYTPNSDIAAIFNKERKAIAFINYGFSTSVGYKELFIDLYVYYTKTPREEAASLIQKVIESGEPVVTGSEESEGTLLKIENGRLEYHVW